MLTHIARLARCNRGATAIEYGLIIVCIALALVGGMSALGGSMESLFERVNSNYSAAASAG